MSPPSSPRVRAFVRSAVRHGRTLWIAALLLGVPAMLRTAHLYAHLHGEVEELLPLDAPSVRALAEMRARFRGLQFLGVVAEVTSASELPGAERLMDDLADRIRTYPRELVREVRTSNADVTAFLEQHAGLYIDLEDLRELRRRIEARRDYEVAKQAGQLLDETEPPPPLDTSDLEEKYKARTSSEIAGHLSSVPLGCTLAVVEAGDFGINANKSRELLRRVQRDVADLVPSRYASGVRVGYASDIAVSAEELSALETDLSISSVLVVLAVVAAILVYYRWWGSIPALLAPLLLAAVYAFAVASLPPFGVAALNSNTAFLGSIIIGNGINVGLILLARYREERSRGATVEDALVTGVWGARVGTLVAAAAAAVSYASLAATDFRGFRQFGCIGGIGMLLSWATAFLLMPPLLAWLDRSEAPVRAASDPSASIMDRVFRIVSGSAPWILAVAAVLAIASGREAARFDRSRLEYDLSQLRRVDTWKSGEGFWGRKMDALLGHYLTPTMLLFDTPEQARVAGKLVRASVEHGPLNPLVARVIGIDDVLPLEQEGKIAELRRIRRVLTPRIESLVPEDKREGLDKLMAGVEQLRPIGPQDLPRPITTGLREDDGTIGRTLLVYPRPSGALWKADSVGLFVDTLRSLAAEAAGATARPGRLAGSIPLSDDLLRSIAHDAPIASSVSFLGVLTVLVLLDRPVALWVTASLALGVLWLVGATLGLGVKINFANFIAFPITFGIGIDYAVNVMNRYVQDGARDIRGAVRSTGGAVALCSLTTIIGYSSLLLAKNRALFLFGLVAVLGEVSCLSAAVLALPAWLVCEQRIRARFGRVRANGSTD